MDHKELHDLEYSLRRVASMQVDQAKITALFELARKGLKKLPPVPNPPYVCVNIAVPKALRDLVELRRRKLAGTISKENYEAAKAKAWAAAYGAIEPETPLHG